MKTNRLQNVLLDQNTLLWKPNLVRRSLVHGFVDKRSGYETSGSLKDK